MNHAVHTPLHGMHLPCLIDEVQQEALLFLFTSTSAAGNRPCPQQQDNPNVHVAQTYQTVFMTLQNAAFTCHVACCCILLFVDADTDVLVIALHGKVAAGTHLLSL